MRSQVEHLNVKIEARNVEITPSWKSEIEERMADLQRGHDDITHGRVTLTMNRRHKKARLVAEAIVIISLPRRHTLTSRKEEKTFEEAIRSAFAALEVELRKFREKRARKDIRLSPIPMRGVISKLFFHEDYGFILNEGGGEVYFHRNAVHGLKFEDLEDGQEVVFNVEQGIKGLQATTVNPVPVLPRQPAI